MPIHDLTVKNGDLIAATHGRSFWILDNVALLHQLDGAVLSARTHLFAPRATVRFRAGASLTAQLDGFGAGGRNPPAGIAVSYFLKNAPTGEVALTISDAKGREIRRFSSQAGGSTAGGSPSPSNQIGRASCRERV